MTRTVLIRKKTSKDIWSIAGYSDRKLIENNLKTVGRSSIAQKVSGVGSWRYDVLKDELLWN